MSARKLRDVDGGITELGPRRFRVRVTVGYDPETGKQIRESHTVRGTRTDARALKSKMAAERRGVTAYEYGKMPVDEWVEDVWLPTRDLQPTTHAGYMATIRNHIQPKFHSVTVEGLSPLFVRRVFKTIPDAGARLNVYKLLRAAMNLALEEGVVSISPIKKADRPELDEYDADTYTLDELVTVLDFARGNATEPGLIVAACCALRRSETCALDWTDLVLARDGKRLTGAVSVRESYHRVDGVRYEAPTKTKRSVRTLPLPAFAVERLLELRGEARIGPLMMDTTGQRMTPDGFTSRWRRLMLVRKNAEGEVIYQPPVRYVELKNLRHSNITALLELGIGMHRVSMWAGHSNERTTDTRYNQTHSQGNMDTAAADAIDGAVRKARRVLTRPNEAR